jgi:hypothetical protein
MLTIILDSEARTHLERLVRLAEPVVPNYAGDNRADAQVAVKWAKDALRQPPHDQLADVPEEILDELVHECMSNDASEINNQGRDAQIRYLLEHAGMTVKDILKEAGL